MSNVEQIYKNVLKDIVPTINEISTINHLVDKLKILLKKRAQEQNIRYTTMEPQGSTGIKQTQLRNDFDIDFFIGLNLSLIHI